MPTVPVRMDNFNGFQGDIPIDKYLFDFVQWLTSKDGQGDFVS